MSQLLVPENEKSNLLEKEKIYFAFREKEIDEEKFLKDLEGIDNPPKTTWKRVLGKTLLVVVSLLLPFLFFSRTLDT